MNLSEIVAELEDLAMDTDVDPAIGSTLAHLALKIRTGVAQGDTVDLISGHTGKVVRTIQTGASETDWGRGSRAGRRIALLTLLETLDGWVDGAKENHEANGHWGENIGSECWRSFEVDDIRNMINDAAREVGIDPVWKGTNG